MKYTITISGLFILLITCSFTFGFLSIKNTVGPGTNNYPPPIFCEGFNSSAFPPSGWSVLYTGTNYWSRVLQSGFNLGTGSAKYDMWNAPSGTVQSLVTAPFAPVNNGDTLLLDIAFCPYPNSQDSLIILGSTNGGSTFISLARLGPSDMQTTTNCSRPFLPLSASDWSRKSFILLAGINTIAFVGQSEFGDNVYLDSICVNSNPVGIHRYGGNLPTSYLLYQNYPNPFNPETKIKYQIPKTGFVNLVVYNVLGKTVKVLVNETKQAGIYEANFNAEGLSSGVYFYTISAGDFKQTMKMLVIK